MAKKIYDIMPPKAKHKSSPKAEAVKKTAISGEKKAKPHKEIRQHKNNFSWIKFLSAVGSVIVLALAVFFYFKLQKAEVEIWPKTDVLSFSQKIIADKSVDSIDISKNLIPAQLLEEEKDLWQEFPATGQAQNDSKAKGVIKIFNSYDPTTQITLVAGTHILSDSGKYFVTLKKVTVPAAKKVNGKITPGSIDANVEAKETGSSYNIGPSKFSFPKLAGTPYYYSIFASSSNSMSGGFEKNVKLVTADDIQNAKDNIIKKISDEASANLKNKISSGDVLIDNSIAVDTVESSSAVKEGATVDKFNYQAKVKATALVFKKQDLEKFAKDYIISKTQNSKIILDKSFSINYTPDLLDIKGGKITLNSDFSSKVYSDINKSNLESLFLHKNRDEILSIIDDNIGGSILKANVNFWPFWTQKAPAGEGKIKISLIFD